MASPPAAAAATSTAPPHQPVLLLLKGQPGSGKSTLAAALAAALRWPLIDKDDSRSSFQPLVAAHPGIDWNDLAYQVMWRTVETQLRCGLSAIVDCPLARRALFDRAAALAAQHGAQLALVELLPSDEALWRQRLEQRGARDRGTHHEHKPGSWQEVEAIRRRNGGSEGWSERVVLPLRCVLDSTGAGLGEQRQRVLQMLAAAGVLEAAALVAGGEAAGGDSRAAAAAAAARAAAAPWQKRNGR